MPPADYLTKSYYEHWLFAYGALMLESGLVSEAEMANGRADPATPKHAPKVRPEDAARLVSRPGAGRRDVEVAPKFRTGDSVVARVTSPAGHTRLPRYLRGKRGVIDRDHGVFVFADSNAHGDGEKPQHVYAVRFTAREVWGEAAKPRDSVTADLWDDHLEPG
jgi:nitrile hydratase